MFVFENSDSEFVRIALNVKFTLFSKEYRLITMWNKKMEISLNFKFL
jgi:hypothetical protein